MCRSQVQNTECVLVASNRQARGHILLAPAGIMRKELAGDTGRWGNELEKL